MTVNQAVKRGTLFCNIYTLYIYVDTCMTYDPQTLFFNVIFSLRFRTPGFFFGKQYFFSLHCLRPPPPPPLLLSFSFQMIFPSVLNVHSKAYLGCMRSAGCMKHISTRLRSISYNAEHFLLSNLLYGSERKLANSIPFLMVYFCRDTLSID